MRMPRKNNENLCKVASAMSHPHISGGGESPKVNRIGGLWMGCTIPEAGIHAVTDVP